MDRGGDRGCNGKVGGDCYCYCRMSYTVLVLVPVFVVLLRLLPPMYEYDLEIMNQVSVCEM